MYLPDDGPLGTKHVADCYTVNIVVLMVILLNKQIYTKEKIIFKRTCMSAFVKNCIFIAPQ
jgi:hypothetical protein